MEKKTRKNQCDRVLEYMNTHGGITDTEARDELHLNRLSGRIFDLKKLGYPIGKLLAAPLATLQCVPLPAPKRRLLLVGRRRWRSNQQVSAAN